MNMRSVGAYGWKRQKNGNPVGGDLDFRLPGCTRIVACSEEDSLGSLVVSAPDNEHFLVYGEDSRVTI